MHLSEIQPGMKFGHWEVIKFDHVNKHRIKYWLCRCDVCGTERPVRGTSLISGYSVACSKQCADTLIGQTFGEWTVLKQDKSKPRNYICRCSCGTVKSVDGSSLKRGMSKSCGCKKVKDICQRNKENAESHVGERYGKLTIIGYELKGKNYWYRCKCDCGSEITTIGKRLFSGGVYSCGCVNSRANEVMDKILREKNIPFKREYRFADCCDKRPLPFDFAIFNNEDELVGLMELNGSQHYGDSPTGFYTEEMYDYIQKHDRIKMNFCKQNHIPLLVIPYQFFDELEKFLTTSNFWRIVTKNFNDQDSLFRDSEEHGDNESPKDMV